MGYIAGIFHRPASLWLAKMALPGGLHVCSQVSVQRRQYMTTFLPNFAFGGEIRKKLLSSWLRGLCAYSEAATCFHRHTELDDIENSLPDLPLKLMIYHNKRKSRAATPR